MQQEQITTREQTWQPTLATVFDCWQYFSVHLGADQLYQRVLDAVVQATHSDRAALMLLDENEQALVISAAIGLSPEAIATTEVKLGEGIAGWVAQNGHPLLLPNESNKPDVPVSVREAMKGKEITSALCVPLVAEGRTLGVLYLTRQSNGAPFMQRDLWFTSVVAERVAVALQTARLYSQLESRERFTTRILESVPSSLLVIDRSLRIVSVNRNFLDKSRRNEQTTLGRKIDEVFPQVLAEYTRLDQKVREVFSTGQSVEGGKVSYRAPGVPTRLYYYRLVPLKVDETVENVMLLMDDITEREQLKEEVRQAERHLAGVVECASDLVVSMDSQGRIVTWNRAAERTSGLRVEHVKGQSLPSLCAVEQRQEMMDMLRGLVRGKPLQNTEVNLQTINGQREVPIAWSCSPMRDDAGTVVGIVAVGRDLTERRRLETQLIQSAKMTSLGGMAGGIAHELRNPLGIISVSAQLMLEHPDDAQLRNECGQKIYTATQRASQIIENLLKFARPVGERMREVEVHAMLEETFALLVHQMALQKVALQKELRAESPRVRGNPEMLQQVFTNLILNACNAMPEGGTLTVATYVVKRGMVEIRFSDNGQGIPPDHLSKIFDPFFTTMPVGTGIGLGLSISYSIVQQHQGTIEVESEMGKGTTFVVRLPTDSK